MGKGQSKVKPDKSQSKILQQTAWLGDLLEDFIGGGEGNWTPVRKPVHTSFSERSLPFLPERGGFPSKRTGKQARFVSRL